MAFLRLFRRPAVERLIHEPVPHGHVQHERRFAVKNVLEFARPSRAVVGADEGFAKTYQFTIDNKLVPLQPTIYMDFDFEGEGGQGNFTLLNQTSGSKVEVPGKGTLKVSTKAPTC